MTTTRANAPGATLAMSLSPPSNKAAGTVTLRVQRGAGERAASAMAPGGRGSLIMGREAQGPDPILLGSPYPVTPHRYFGQFHRPQITHLSSNFSSSTKKKERNVSGILKTPGRAPVLRQLSPGPVQMPAKTGEIQVWVFIPGGGQGHQARIVEAPPAADPGLALSISPLWPEPLGLWAPLLQQTPPPTPSGPSAGLLRLTTDVGLHNCGVGPSCALWAVDQAPWPLSSVDASSSPPSCCNHHKYFQVVPRILRGTKLSPSADPLL